MNKIGEPGEKPQWHEREQWLQQTLLTYSPVPEPGLEPGLQQWEASGLATHNNCPSFTTI